MTALDTLFTFIEQRIADAEADLGPEGIGWIGMDAMNRAGGRVSALREVQDKLAELEREERSRKSLWNETWIGKDMSPLEQWNADGNR